jgi:hypothetical protein
VDLDEVGAAASKFSSDHFRDAQKYVPLADIITKVKSEMGLVSMDMGEVPDLVAPALLLDPHKLSPTIVEKAFPAVVQMGLYNLKADKWAETLMKCQDNGLKMFRDRALHLTG